MSLVPVVKHHEPRCSQGDIDRADLLASELLAQVEDPRSAELRRLQADRLDDLPTLHLDDLGEIQRIEPGCDTSFLQDRARLRAGDGDLVAVHRLPPSGYEEYCRNVLGIGSVGWLQPLAGDPAQIAAACWEDRSIRHELVRRVRHGALRYLHPHMGTRSVWELAALLSAAAGREVKVIAPLPNVSRFANDKGAFTRLVRDLLGREAGPHTVEVENLTQLCVQVQALAPKVHALGIKLPSSAGGGGNLVLPAADLRGCSLHAVREILKTALRRFPEDSVTRLLVTAWESGVISAPSVQIWVPPHAMGEPLVEGVFEQVIVGEQGMFVGSRPASLPSGPERTLVDECWLISRVLQRLGYLGRCSFDAILLENERLELIECNARWGGASLPMTLMNRLFGDWARRSYATREWRCAGLERIPFQRLLDHFQSDLFDARTGAGSYVLYNPTALSAASRVDVLALGASAAEAAARASIELPERLRTLVSSRYGRRRCPAPCSTPEKDITISS
ncbi:MAG: hypothetical protein ACO1SX_21715 [Actinomycetota bacterium]